MNFKLLATLFIISTPALADMETIFKGDESPLSFYGVTNKINHMRLSQVEDPNDTIIMFGDSILQGLNYRGLHFNHLNMGIGGDSVHGIKQRVKAEDLGSYKAVFIEAGANNLLLAENGVQLGMEMTELIDYAAPKSKKLYVSDTFVPNKNKYHQISADYSKANEAIKLACDKYKNCEVVPLPTGLIGPEGIDAKYSIDDGVHLNGAAYSLWSAELNKAMTEFPYSVYYKYFK
jgi:lysophospholipase L1-like esterase